MHRHRHASASPQHTAGCQQRARAASLATASQQPSRVQGDGDTDGILVLSPDRDIQLEIRDEVVATMRMGFVSFADWLEIEGKMMLSWLSK